MKVWCLACYRPLAGKIGKAGKVPPTVPIHAALEELRVGPSVIEALLSHLLGSIIVELSFPYLFVLLQCISGTFFDWANLKNSNCGTLL